MSGMNDLLDHSIFYTGVITDYNGDERYAVDELFMFVEHLPEERDVGLFGDCVIVVSPGIPLDVVGWEDKSYSIDTWLWASAVCKATGGHNFVDHQWSEEPESTCRICTRCGEEIDPA